MSHWVALPVILPSLMAPLLVLAMRHDLGLQRVFSAATTFTLAAIAIGLFVSANSAEAPQVYAMGDWAAPFGIVLVLDRLSALMLLLTALLAVAVILYVVGTNWDDRGRHFHPLFQFQLMGVNGAFLTGDAFNLFVFFEVLLIASYGLLLHGGGAGRMRAGVQYVAVNLGGSTLFLFALGALYALTGTLNMADLAVRVPELDPGDTALIRVAALLLLLVFAVKAAMVPLHFWLPGAYSEAPAPVAALFAVMTKVGAYAIIRFYTLVFGEGAGEVGGIAADWLMPAALVTGVLGTIGVMGARGLGALVAFSVVGSMGTLLIAVALFTPAGTSAALYYLVHSTFAAAALFLIAEQVALRRGVWGDAIRPAPPMAGNELMAGLWMAGAVAMVGLPPLSGFLGKLLVLDVARQSADVWLIWAVILGGSLVAVVGFAKAGSTMFWKSWELREPVAPAPPASALALAATVALTAAPALLAAFAGPAMGYFEATAAELHAPAGYIEAVLGSPEAMAGAESLRAGED